jgi:hypothetical protein
VAPLLSYILANISASTETLNFRREGNNLINLSRLVENPNLNNIYIYILGPVAIRYQRLFRYPGAPQP